MALKARVNTERGLKKMKNRMNLTMFEEGGAGGQGASGGQSSSGGSGGHPNAGATYSFEQAEEIASARATKAERAALANFFRSQGMTEDEITSAINDFKAKRQANTPNVSEIEKERDQYKSQIEKMENEKYLSSKGVNQDDLDYVSFKVGQMVDDKTDFKKAADTYLKDNPRYTGQVYRVSTSSKSGGNDGSGSSGGNDFINAAIRKAAGR